MLFVESRTRRQRQEEDDDDGIVDFFGGLWSQDYAVLSMLFTFSVD